MPSGLKPEIWTKWRRERVDQTLTLTEAKNGVEAAGELRQRGIKLEVAELSMLSRELRRKARAIVNLVQKLRGRDLSELTRELDRLEERDAEIDAAEVAARNRWRRIPAPFRSYEPPKRGGVFTAGDWQQKAGAN